MYAATADLWFWPLSNWLAMESRSDGDVSGPQVGADLQVEQPRHFREHAKPALGQAQGDCLPFNPLP